MLAVDFEVPTWAPLAATLGQGDQSDRHAHHALHFVIAREGELLFRTDAGEHLTPGVLTRADVPHHVDAEGLEVLLVFLDPESHEGRRLTACVPPSGVRLFNDAERAQLLAGVTAATFQGPEGPCWLARAAELLETPTSPRAVPQPAPAPLDSAPTTLSLAPAPLDSAPTTLTPFDARVRRALEHIRAHPAETHSLESLAAAVELSPSRFLHLFTASVGIPVRPYLAWLRFQRATALLGTPAPLARVAAEAGFADAAHMTRAFRSMFGVTPSQLRERGALRG